MTDKRDNNTEPALYPIRTVATLTGVNPITLRAWERRYGLIKPHRSPKGHRLYSRDQIDRINQVVALLDKGIAISQVENAMTTGAPAGDSTTANVWQRYLDRMVGAITRFDEAALEDDYDELLGLYPVNTVTRRLLVPLLELLGERWATAVGSVAEEHFFATYMRNKLGARFHHRARRDSGPKLLAACLPGEHHEIGLLLFALAAHDRGYRVVLLGGDTPLEELAPAARRARVDAVVLSGSVDPDPELFSAQLRRVSEALSLPLFIGGTTSVRHRDAILRAGAEALGEDMDAALRHITETLGARPRAG